LVALFVPLWLGLYGRPKSQWAAILPIVLGISFFMARWLPERVFLPMPKDIAAPAEYQDYVAQELIDGIPLPRTGSESASMSSLANGLSPNSTGDVRLSKTAGLVRDLLVVKEDWYGLGASLIGYLLAQVLFYRRKPINDQTLKDAWGDRWNRFD
jgi:hypothetical protein